MESHFMASISRKKQPKHNQQQLIDQCVVEPFGSSRTRFDRVEKYFLRRHPTILVGQTGSGKTMTVEYLAAKHGLPIELVTGSAELTVAELVGRGVRGSKLFPWSDHALTRAVTLGSIFYLDEVDELSDAVLKTLHPLLDHRRTLVLNAKDGTTIKAHEDFRFIASANPPCRLPPEFRQRCRIVTYEYLPEEEEISFLMDRVGVSSSDARFLVQIAKLIRERLQGIVDVVSTRLLMTAAEDLLDGDSREDVVIHSILDVLTDDADARAQTVRMLRSAGFLSLDVLKRFPLPADETNSVSLDDDDFFESSAT